MPAPKKLNNMLAIAEFVLLFALISAMYIYRRMKNGVSKLSDNLVSNFNETYIMAKRHFRKQEYTVVSSRRNRSCFRYS